MVLMSELKRRKRVSWARDGNLCKVRLFLSEDAPSQSGFGAQDHLQAKTAWLLHAASSDDSLPPGFEKLHQYQPEDGISKISLVRWQCPPRLVLNPDWLVVAGEESQEVAIENHRQLGVLEAIYPRSSAIPPNPAVAPEAKEASVSDPQTPLIPMTAIEDEDTTEVSNVASASNHASVQSQSYPVASTPQHVAPQDTRSTVQQSQPQPNEVPQLPNLPRVEQPTISTKIAMAMASIAPSAEPDVVAAASAAFTAIMRSCEEGSLIDRDLLIKILSNPDMVEKLVYEYGGLKQIQPPNQNPLLLPPQPVAATSAGVPPKQTSLPLASQLVATTSAGAPPKPTSLPFVTQHMAATSAGAPPKPTSLPFVTQHMAATSAGVPSKQIPLPFVSQHLATTSVGIPPPPCRSQFGPIPVQHTYPPQSMMASSASSTHHSAVQVPTMPPTNVPLTRDANYYKSLIQLHGSEQQEALYQNTYQFKNVAHQFSTSGGLRDYQNNMVGVSNGVEPFGQGVQKQGDTKPKAIKPCMYFNTPRGCRHGASCLFQHDESLTHHRVIEQPQDTAKRIKLDRERGRNN